MPFGRYIAPATSQRVMNDILRDLLHKFVSVYLDNVYVFRRTQEEHLKHPRLVLQRFKEEGLKLRRNKCFLGPQEMEYMGYIVFLEKSQFRQRNSRPLQIGRCLRRRRRFSISSNSAISTPYSSTTLATLRHH
jgi:hypothetical protein